MVVHATGMDGFVMYFDFMAMYGPQKPDYTKLAEERERSGFYTRLQASMRARDERERCRQEHTDRGTFVGVQRDPSLDDAFRAYPQGYEHQPFRGYENQSYQVQSYQN